MYKKGGLTHFETGGSTTDAAVEESIAPLTKAARAPTSKAGYQFPTISGDVPLDKNVLSAMEELYQNRQAEYGAFRESIQDE